MTNLISQLKSAQDETTKCIITEQLLYLNNIATDTGLSLDKINELNVNLKQRRINEIV